MTKIVAEMHKVFEDSFMQPKCYQGREIEMEVMEAGLDLESDKYYCRLSADGYLDCTDLSGPFETIDDCATYLIDTYGPD